MENKVAELVEKADILPGDAARELSDIVTRCNNQTKPWDFILISHLEG